MVYARMYSVMNHMGDSLLYTLGGIAYALLLILTAVVIIMRSDDQGKVLAYLFLIVSLPVVGMVFYYTFGYGFKRRSMYNKKLATDADMYDELQKSVGGMSNATIAKHQDELGHFASLANTVNHQFLTCDYNTLSLLINGERKFPDVIEALRRAKNHIHVQYYIFRDDHIGKMIGDLLREKARAGVEVRLIYDDLGSHGLAKRFCKQLEEAGVELHPFLKVGLPILNNRFNYRNHRKIIVIDGTVGYVGGINVGDEYVNDGRSKLYWRDTHMKIEGMGVMNLQHIFLADWNFCAGQNIGIDERYFPYMNHDNQLLEQGDGGVLTQIVASGPDSQWAAIMYSVVQAISLSQQEVLITTPYFIPTQSYIDALKIAALSGVTVKVLVPDVGDSVFVNAASRSHYRELLEAGIEVYAYTRGFVHAKTMVCDSQVAIVGTANMDIRSFDLNFEVNGIVYDTSFAKELREQFYRDLDDAKQLELNEWVNRSFWTILFERIMRLFSPLM